MRVSFFVSETTADRMNAAQTIIRDIRQRWTRLGVDLAQAIDQRAFAQGPTARAKRFDVQGTHGAFEDLPARDDDFRSLIADAWESAPLGDAHFTDPRIKSPELSKSDLVTGRSRAF